MKSKNPLVVVGMICLALILGILSWTPACAPAPAEEAPGKVWHMKYDFYNIEKCEPAIIDKWAFEEIVRRSNGRIEIDFYWAGALHKTGEHWAACRDGLSELTFINFGYYMSETPISRGVEWSWKPGAADVDVHMKMMNKLYEEIPEWRAEYEDHNMHVLWFTNWGPADFDFKEPKPTLDSIRGMRIRSYGVAGEALDAIGAVPTPVKAPEIFTSVERGILDGTLMIPVGFYLHTGLYEILPYEVGGHYGVCGPSALVMNKELWDSLPKDLKKLFNDMGDELVASAWTEHLQAFTNECVDKLVAEGTTFLEWPPEEVAKAASLVQPAEVERWIADMEKVNPDFPARKFQERAEELLKELGPSTYVTPHVYYKEKYGK